MALFALGLCVGTAGLELGVKLACPGVRLVGAVERQAYCAALIRAAMVRGDLDDAPIFDDVAEFDGRPWRGVVDLVLAGYPCQGESLAGRGDGVEDDRWLWPEVLRIVDECGARYLFCENVAGHISRSFRVVLEALAARGWSVEWDLVPAQALGAPHIRERVFFLACAPNADGHELRFVAERDQRDRWGVRETVGEPAFALDDGEARYAADADGFGCLQGDVGTLDAPSRKRHAAEFDSWDADCASDAESERLRRGREDEPHARRGPEVDRCGEAAANARGIGLEAEEGGNARGSSERGDTADRDRAPGAAGNPADADRNGRARKRRGGKLDQGERAARGRDVDRRRGAGHRHADPLAEFPDDVRGRLEELVATGAAYWTWSRAPEPVLFGMDDGTAATMERAARDEDERLLAIGNGVVPLAAAFAFTVLRYRHFGF